MITQNIISLTAAKRGLLDITSNITDIVSRENIITGLCNIFLHHTSASLTICENYDPLVLSDLENFMLRLIPDGDPLFQHVAEGQDDMPSHVRNILTQSSLTIPITNKKLALGTWQGIFLWEHRIRPFQRTLTITLTG